MGSVLDFLFFKLKIESVIIHSLPVFCLEEMKVPVLPRKQTKGMSMDGLPFFTSFTFWSRTLKLCVQVILCLELLFFFFFLN